MADDERVIPGLTFPKYVKEHIARYEFALPYCVGKVVLDAACGVGFGSKILSQKAKKVIGWDVSRKALEYAQENYPGENIDYQRSDLDKIKIPDEVDIVVSFETIEHLKTPQKFINRVFKKAKQFIFSVPLRCPNEHHLHIYNSFDEVKRLIGKSKVEWYGQKLFEGDFAITQPASEGYAYIIGIWQKYL